MTNNQALKFVNQMLADAIQVKDKKRILDVYETIENINLEDVDQEVFDRYNELVSDANDILNS